MSMMRTPSQQLVLFLVLATNAWAEQSCEKLKATLTYTQEEAPRDLSSVVSNDAVVASS